MKKNFKILIIAVLLVISPLLMLAQVPPHPNNGIAPTAGTNGPVGGGASIDSESCVLLIAAMAYGAYRFCRMRTGVSIVE